MASGCCGTTDWQAHINKHRIIFLHFSNESSHTKWFGWPQSYPHQKKVDVKLNILKNLAFSFLEFFNRFIRFSATTTSFALTVSHLEFYQKKEINKLNWKPLYLHTCLQFGVEFNKIGLHLDLKQIIINKWILFHSRINFDKFYWITIGRYNWINYG
jgi:hypothetical protein